jgi:polyisoprenoid-binding protein YceI
MKAVMAVLIGLAAAGAIVGSAAGAEKPCVVEGRGHFYIHTDAGGLFGAFAHEHLIEAQKIEGCAAIDSADLMGSSIKLTFKTANIRVIDPKETESTRSKVQSAMDSDVLRTSQFPEVVFQSTGIERGSAADAFRVRGNLTIRGKTQAITVPLTMTQLNDGTYRAKGEYTLKQTAFGIQPIRIAGGTVKVKDEVRVEFELFLK